MVFRSRCHCADGPARHDDFVETLHDYVGWANRPRCLRFEAWRAPHRLTLKYDAYHWAPAVSARVARSTEHESATLSYLYGLCGMVIAHVTT